MIDPIWNGAVIKSSRFELRPITEADVTERYLGWFSGRGAGHITQHPKSVEDLRAYVREKSNRPDILFLAIRLAEDGRHIGNLKFEPIDLARQGAILGIFVGEQEWQGKGVATEAIRAAGQWLHDRLGIRHLWLGVADDNAIARQAYEKLGFINKPCPLIPASPGIETMELDLSPQLRA